MKKIALLIPVMLLSQIVHVNAMRNFRRSARKMHHRRGRQRKRRMFNKVQKRKQQKTLSKKRKRQEVINFDVAKNQKRSATFPSLTSSAAFSFGKYSLLSKILFFYAIILSSKQVVGRVCQGECGRQFSGGKIIPETKKPKFEKSYELPIDRSSGYSSAKYRYCQKRCDECDRESAFGSVRPRFPFDLVGGGFLNPSFAFDLWQCRECDDCGYDYPEFRKYSRRF